jgi:hypothetical protein
VADADHLRSYESDSERYVAPIGGVLRLRVMRPPCMSRAQDSSHRSWSAYGPELQLPTGYYLLAPARGMLSNRRGFEPPIFIFHTAFMPFPAGVSGPHRYWLNLDSGKAACP